MKIETNEQQDALVAAVKQWFRERHAERQVDDSKKDNTTSTRTAAHEKAG